MKPGSERDVGTCVVCGRRRALNDLSGMVMPHVVQRGVRCEGSNQPPAESSIWKSRQLEANVFESKRRDRP